MKSSFNAFGKTKKVFDAASTPVWLGTVTPVPKGGVLHPGSVIPGAIYPAGSPVVYEYGVITPFVTLSVVAVTGNSITVRPASLINEDSDYVPAVNGYIGEATTSDDWEVISPYKVLSMSRLANGDFVLSLEGAGNLKQGTNLVVCGSDGAILAPEGQPNAYLYNDICIGDIDASEENVEAGIASATGAVVMYHAEGILIDRTPAAAIAGYMAKAVPGVLQVKG